MKRAFVTSILNRIHRYFEIAKVFIILIIGLNLLSCITMEKNIVPVEDQYFGLKTPGLIPEVFAKGIVSDSTWAEHCQIAISPKGDEIYWSAWSSTYPKADGTGNTEQIYYSQYKNSTWTKPALAEFVKDNITNINGGPVFSPDGNKLFFYSVDRPGGYGGMDTWYVTRTGTGWSKPVNAGKIYNSVSSNWSPIFTAMGNAYVNFDGTVKFRYDGENFTKPDSIVIHKDFNPVFPIYISPDESYVIFDSFKKDNYGDLDLYISFKTQDGSWEYPINMGPEVNTELRERFPIVSPDGKYMFFMRHTPGQDFFWVSTDIIENLRKQSEGEKEMDESPVTEAPHIDESLSYSELQSQAIEHYRNDRMDSAILYMEYAQKKFPENDMQTINILAQMYTRDGQYAKAVAIWKQGINKGFFYDLNNPKYQQYYKNDSDFAELAKIEKDKTDASHILHEVLLPENYNSSQRYPVLFIFHGNNRNIELSKTVWKSETMTENFISVFVQSYVNMGKDTFQWLPDDDKTDSEFKEIYDNILKTYSVDTNHIIFAGMSAGGRKVIEYTFNELIPMSGLVLNCPVIPPDITSEDVMQFVEKNKRIGIISGGQDFALAAQKKLLSDIDDLNGKTKLVVYENLGHEFSEDFSIKLDEYLKWVIE